MIAGQIFAGVAFGLLAFFASLFLGASLWFAMGIYAMVGAATLIVSPVVALVVHAVLPRAKISSGNDTTSLQANAIIPFVPPAAVTTGSMSILAVDDDPFILEVIPVISAQVGFSDITVASSAKQALGLLRDTEKHFDCLLLDISMPDMNGIDLCRQVRKLSEYRETPIVMLTAMRDLDNIGDAFRAGATDYATKPFDIEELGRRLQRAQGWILNAGRTDQSEFESIESNAEPLTVSDSERTAITRMSGAFSLVDPVVMSNYLTQLPRRETAEVEVFAIRIERRGGLRIRISAQQFNSLREDILAIVQTCFVAERSLMSFADEATLIVAANVADTRAAFKIEIDIERNLAALTAEPVADIGVSVGGPVQLEGAKSVRAMRAMERAVGLAEQRTMTKQSRSLSGLSKRNI